MLFMLYKRGKVHFCLLGRQRMEDFLLRTGVVVRVSNCTKERAARAARLFFVILPIKSLIDGVIVAVSVVVS